MQEKFKKYLGLLTDSHLSWKYYMLHISKKIKRSNNNNNFIIIIIMTRIFTIFTGIDMQIKLKMLDNNNSTNPQVT